MKLRGYQREALTSVLDAFKANRSTLLVLPTGCGKTVTFAHCIAEMRHAGRAMVIAHREELIAQAARTIEAIIGEAPSVEMGQQWADGDWLNWRSHAVVSTVQTQVSGRGGHGRMSRFPAADFGLCVVDEAHHSTADTYRSVIDHYQSNPMLRLLGVTATPNRADEAALGQVFETCAFNYGISDAINDGWLVPIEQTAIHLDGVDLSRVKTTGGDLNSAQLEQRMIEEKPLLGVADAAIKESAGKRCLVFTSGVKHAEMLCEILNRYECDCARWVHGKTPRDIRRETVRDFAAGKFRFMVNCAIFTEGFDDPGIECIVMARPTKSLPLYMQMLGRGTRPLPGVVDGLEDDDELILPVGHSGGRPCDIRRNAIAESGKPSLHVIDFTANSGRHKLITAVDALGGEYADDVIDEATHDAERGGQQKNVMQRIQEAAENLKKRHEAAQEKARKEAEARKHIRGEAHYRTTKLNPFDILDIQRTREPGFGVGPGPSEKQRALLERWKVDPTGMSKRQATQIIGTLIERSNKNLISYKQAEILKVRGFPINLTRDEAKPIMDALAANRWKMTPQLERLRDGYRGRMA